MTPEQLAALGTALAAFLRPFQPCFTQQRTADHLHTYCRGLLSDLPRKQVRNVHASVGAFNQNVWLYGARRAALVDSISWHSFSASFPRRPRYRFPPLKLSAIVQSP